MVKDLNLKQLTGLQRKAANLANMNDKKDLVLDSDDIKKFKEYIEHLCNIKSSIFCRFRKKIYKNRRFNK